MEIYSDGGAGNFSLFTSILTGNNTSPGALISADLAVALDNANSVLVLLGNGAGAFTVAGTGACGADPRSTAVADMDNDGKLDVVTANRDGNSVSVLRNNGTGSLAAGMNTNVGSDVRGVALGDFNGDGMMDIAGATSLNNDSWATVFTNVGGSFGAPVHYALLAADFDLDLETTNQDSNNVSVLINPNSGASWTSLCTSSVKSADNAALMGAAQIPA